MKLRKLSLYPVITQSFKDLYELADVMEVSSKTASRVLDGTRAFTLKEKERICKYLKLSRSEVFGDQIVEAEPPKQEPVEEVHVGDEVIYDAVKGIVVREPYSIGTGQTQYICINFITHMCSCELKQVKKTGRNFPEIEKLRRELALDR